MSAHRKTLPQTLPEQLNARAARAGWPSTCDDRLVFDNARLQDLTRIWHAVRGGQALPRRGDFTARTLVRHLCDIAFVERVPGTPRRYRFGFYGSNLARYTGDGTGKFLDAMVPAQFIEPWCAAYDTVLEAGAPLRFVSHFRAFDLDYMTAESLIAPLCDAQGEASGLLASAVYTPRVA